jgi:hypothetical protein
MPDRLQRPDWYSKPPQEWPSSAREFYRLCWTIARRIQVKQARQAAGGSDAPPDADLDTGTP